MLDSSVEHRVWHVFRYGFKAHNHFKSEMPFGVIVPLFFSLFTLGMIKVMTFLTYETHALKHRAAKRFGFYSYTEMTDWHNGLIGAAGIIATLIVSLIGYRLSYKTNIAYMLYKVNCYQFESGAFNFPPGYFFRLFYKSNKKHCDSFMKCVNYSYFLRAANPKFKKS